MPGRRDCSLIGYGRIHHRSEHHEPRPRVARWASGQAPDGRSRRALSQRQQHADAQHGQRRLDDQRHRRLASPSCLEVEPLAGDEPPTRDVPAPLAQPGLVRNWQMVHVLPLSYSHSVLTRGDTRQVPGRFEFRPETRITPGPGTFRGYRQSVNTIR